MSNRRLRGVARPRVRVNDLLADAYARLQKQDWEGAAGILRGVLEQNPENWGAIFLVGIMAGLRKHWDIAIEHLKQAMALNPDPWPEGHNNLGVVYWKLDRTEEAIVEFEKGLVIAPNRPDLLVNKANALHDLGRDDEALVLLDRANAIVPESPSPPFNRAFIQLRHGRYLEGWKNYEARWDLTEWLMDHGRTFPAEARRWQGEPFQGKTLLVHWEQGFGDTIQFARYLPWVKSLGGTVIFEVQRALVPLLRSMEGVDLLVGHGDTLPDYQLYVATMSLPHLHGTTIECIPEPIRLVA